MSVKKFFTNKITLTIYGVIAFFLIWFLISFASGNSARIFPSPIETFSETFLLLTKKITYLHIGSSFLKMVIGFSVSAILGIILGMIVGNHKNCQYVFNPTLIALKTVPTASIVFLFLTIVGAKNTPIFIVSIITFPIIYEATLGGFANIDKELKDYIRLEDCNFIIKNVLIKLPLAAPYIIVGLASSFALSFKIEIMSEVISGSTGYGIGCAIKQTQQIDPTNLKTIFAYSLLAIFLMMLSSLMLFLIKRKVNIK